MDRLPDLTRAATPNPRPENTERAPRDNTRTQRTRSTDKAPSKSDAPERVDDRQRSTRADDASTDRPSRFEVRRDKPAEKPQAKPANDADADSSKAADPNAAEQSVADLVAQQPGLRAKTLPADSSATAKTDSTPDANAAVPSALPTNVAPAEPTSDVPAVEGSATEAITTEARAIDVHATPRALVTASPAAPDVVRAPEARVEAPKETREAQPARDVERAADILRQVRVYIVPRTSEAHLQLEPRELGRVTIDIKVDGDHMRATVRAEKREALDAIQAHLPELRATLRDSGITTQDFQFSLGLQNQPRRQEQQSGREQTRTQTHAIDARETEHAVLLRATAAASGVDFYA